MAGYAVVAVIRGAPVQARDAARAESSRNPPADLRADVLDLTPEGSTLVDDLRDRWAAMRDGFGQLTWYLVNPEGWR